jgi:hypothetical protein
MLPIVSVLSGASKFLLTRFVSILFPLFSHFPLYDVCYHFLPTHFVDRLNNMPCIHFNSSPITQMQSVQLGERIPTCLIYSRAVSNQQ